MRYLHLPIPNTENLFFFPKEKQYLVLERCGEILHARLTYLSPALLLMSMYFLLTDFFLLWKDPGRSAYLFYLVSDIAFLVFQSVFYFVFVVRSGFSSKGKRLLEWKPVFVYALFCLVWAALIAAVEVRQTGNITTIIIAIMTMATLGLFSLPVFLVLVGLPIAIFLGGTLFIPGGNYTLDYENLIFLFSLTLISFVISRSFFAATIGDILKTYKLETLNRELHSIQMSLIQKEKFASIGQLSAGIAHEINNPLGFVKSNISALEQGVGQIRTRYPDLSRDEVYGPFFENLQGLFRDTKEGFRRISEVIDNLRIFAQEMPEGDFGLYNLNQGIESTLVVARSGLSNVTKIEKRLGTVPAIEARGSEINQVLMNLLLNANHAVKNSPSGRETSIIVSTWSENNFVFCEITDSGPGVDPRIKSRIFDPFFTTKPAGVGMGLGLSLSYEIIVNRHRGTLVLKDGLPTTFRMALPIRRPSVGPAINGK